MCRGIPCAPAFRQPTSISTTSFGECGTAMTSGTTTIEIRRMNAVPIGSIAMSDCCSQSARPPREKKSDTDARRETNENLLIERHDAAATRATHRATASSVRSTSAMRMSPMCPMRKPRVAYGPSPAAVRMPRALMRSRNGFRRRRRAGSAIAVSVAECPVSARTLRARVRARRRPREPALAIASCRRYTLL